MALVTARTPASPVSGHQPSKPVSGEVDSRDPDLLRAFKLVELHNEVKMKHVQGQDQGLGQARREVKDTLERLRREGMM